MFASRTIMRASAFPARATCHCRGWRRRTSRYIGPAGAVTAAPAPRTEGHAARLAAKARCDGRSEGELNGDAQLTVSRARSGHGEGDDRVVRNRVRGVWQAPKVAPAGSREQCRAGQGREASSPHAEGTAGGDVRLRRR
jgi:hypothetical protein